jgi:hypothetical protein
LSGKETDNMLPDKRFAVALSFAGETRSRVGPIAELLAQHLTKERVLYDKFHEAEFARPNLDTHLQGLYHNETELIVVVLCRHYDRKMWCGLEWRSIKDLLHHRREDSIMFLRTDDATVTGVYPSDGYISLHDKKDAEIVTLILNRLEQVRRRPSRARRAAGRPSVRNPSDSQPLAKGAQRRARGGQSKKPLHPSRPAPPSTHLEILTAVTALHNLLVAGVNTGITDEAQYGRLRDELLQDPTAKNVLPALLTDSAAHRRFEGQLQARFPSQSERIEFLDRAFSEIREHLLRAHAAGLNNAHAATILEAFDTANVHRVWNKALERCASGDHDGAITIARTLLEAVCRQILNNPRTPPAENLTLPQLYHLVAQQLRLAPQQHTDAEIKKILGSCQNIVVGLGALRNRLGDAHAGALPARRHAELAVQLAGAMACFLVTTWQEHQGAMTATTL